MPLWSVNWYASWTNLDLSADGRHIVRYVPGAKMGDDLALAFYDRGRLLRGYQLAELVRDPYCMLQDRSQESLSTEDWRRSTHFDSDTMELQITTVRGEVYKLQATSGGIVQRELPTISKSHIQFHRDHGMPLPRQ